jgi:hypothetical protein
MAIGDDLQILLGMVPIRDRAGIARGTMADAAAAAAEPRSRPPAFALPPGMLTGSDGAQPPADVQLPDGVNTEYASGKLSPVKAPSLGKGPIPDPSADSERVVASSPMAAPSPGVMRNSEIMYRAMEAQRRQEAMQQLFHGLGQIVGGIRGENVPSRAAGAGAGSNNLNNIQTLMQMRAQEDMAAEALAQKQRRIDDMMQTQNVSRDHARVLVETDEDKKRNDPAELRAAEKIRETSRILQSLEPHIPVYAAAIGMDEDALRLMARNNPEKAIELMKPESIETARQKQLANTETEAAQTARAAELKRLIKIGAPIDEIIAAANPAAAQSGFIKRREQTEEGGQATAVAQRADFEKNHQAKAISARDYLEGPGRTLGDLWTDKLVTGTFSDLRRSVLWRPLATLTGLSDKDLNDTAKVESALKSYVIANAKQLGTNPTDRDARIIAAAGGNTSLSPSELREVIGLNERAERQKIIAAAQRHAELTNSGPKTAREMREIAPIAMPEPSKILKDAVMLASNAPVRQQLVDMKNQLDAHPDDPQAKAAYAKTAANFDRHFGAQMSQAFLNTGGKGWPTK